MTQKFPAVTQENTICEFSMTPAALDSRIDQQTTSQGLMIKHEASAVG